jgi:hypothetical protein
MYFLEQNGDTMQFSAPHYQWKLYTKQITNGAGFVMGMGWQAGSWDWDIISQKQRDWLRTFIPGQSAELWINTKTMDNNEAYVPIHCIGVWPVATETHDAGRRPKFSIVFQRGSTT